MSSFICSPEHFNSIEQSINMLCYGNKFYFPYAVKEQYPVIYDRLHYSAEKIEAVTKGIFDTLRALNATCVVLQYKHNSDNPQAEIEEQIKSLLNNRTSYKVLNNVALFKALQCLTYQIETEHLTKLRPLTEAEINALMFCKEMETALAFDIVNGLEEYQKADWSISI